MNEIFFTDPLYIVDLEYEHWTQLGSGYMQIADTPMPDDLTRIVATYHCVEGEHECDGYYVRVHMWRCKYPFIEVWRKSDAQA